MDKIHFTSTRISKTIALLLTAVLSVPLLAACGGGGSQTRSGSQLPPVDDTRVENQSYRNAPANRPQARKGLSTGQKVAILAGAAALYYLYNQHKNKQQQGPEGKYYLSKNGRVYYRDAQGRAHWVTPPSEGIRVPEQEAQRYRDFQGYNGRTTGRDLTELAPAQ